ncbi:uncharacterized protein LOC121266455 [Juglans microcarpa x Juglans regia]|uniref:uncharacterized protein LOC121266455 n=1 Tax=Juglans microcarpa x Juglans regia TaxID=2249226 RepID=UPI001B7F66DB|nr:uncharacterized protein LOC121266455 [Juglans microcarpa x Juglans regia]
MWQVLLAAAVAGSTGLVAKHLFGPNDTDDPTPSTLPQQTDNPFHAPSSCDGSQSEQDGIFRFSSSGSRAGSGSKNSRIKKTARVKRSSSIKLETEVPRKSARRFAVRLKRRKISKNVASSSASSSSKDGSLFGWGLGVGIMYMMSAGKSEISKLNIAVDETAKVVQELKSEIDKKRSSYHLGISAFASEVDAVPNKNYSNHTQLSVDNFSTGNRDPNDIKVSGRLVFDDGEYASSVLTEDPEPRMHEINQLEAELESELQKLPWCITEASHQEEIRPNLVETEVSAMDFCEAKGQNSDSYQFHGVVPAELDQKLCHLLIEQQEHQIVELESELNLAQSKLNSKEAELQALKDCVKRLTAFSLSTVSDDETEAHEGQEETGEWDYTNKTESESKKVMVGMKRSVDSESCLHHVR